jgi:ATPase subunit of ABC transporter with duplicated ATPase domains
MNEILPTTGSIQIVDEKVALFRQQEEASEISVLEYFADSDIYQGALLKFLADISFESKCCTLSGGEWTRVRLAKIVASEASFIILDEPSNHLDQEGQTAVREMLNVFKGGVLIISHDRKLLNQVDKIIELSTKGVKTVSGNWEEYSHWRESERQQLQKTLNDAKKDRRKEMQQRQDRLEAQMKRQRKGLKDADKGGMPKILLGRRKSNSQESLGKIDRHTSETVKEAIQTASEAYQELKVDPVMFSKIPTVSIPMGKLICHFEDVNVKFSNTETSFNS